MAFILEAAGVALPAPVKVSTTDELIWSQDTGRSASGDMVGTVLARKETFQVEWACLTRSEAETIRTAVSGAGFFNLKIGASGSTQTLKVYRSTLSRELLGYVGGVLYYRSVTVTFIQK